MRRNFPLPALALVVALIGLIAATATGTDLCGDANADGAVDIPDAVYVIGYIFCGQQAPQPLYAADANHDGTVDLSDAIYLINYIFNGGPRPDCPPVTDVDGNIYQTVTIGNQVWMAENLKVTHYRNGDPIPHVTDFSTWASLSTGAHCAYNNDSALVADYSRLYNWYAVNDSRNIAPEGWHVATDAEWQALIDYLGGLVVAGGKMKETGLAHWSSPNAGATNSSGFTALPGGYRRNDGNFVSKGDYAYFWSSTEYNSGYALFRALYYLDSQIHRYYFPNLDGFSVRCVRD